MRIIRISHEQTVNDTFDAFMEENKLTLSVKIGSDVTVRIYSGQVPAMRIKSYPGYRLDTIVSGRGSCEIVALHNLRKIISGKYICFMPYGGIAYKLKVPKLI